MEPGQMYRIVRTVAYGLTAISLFGTLGIIWLIANYDIPGETLAVMIAPIASATTGLTGLIGVIFSVNQVPSPGQVPQLPQEPQLPQRTT